MFDVDPPHLRPYAQRVAGGAEGPAQPHHALASADHPMPDLWLCGHYDLNDVPYAMLDQDRSAASAALLANSTGRVSFIAWPCEARRHEAVIDDRAPCWSCKSAKTSSAGCSPASRPTCR